MKKFIAVSIAIMLIILVAGIAIYTEWLGEGRYPSPEVIPTAEYLAHVPAELPIFIPNIDPDPGATLSESDEICLQMLPGRLMQKGDSYDAVEGVLTRNTAFYINNRPLPFYIPIRILRPAGLFEIVEGQETGTIVFCFTPELERGTHLAEIKTRDLSGREYSYQWGFRFR